MKERKKAVPPLHDEPSDLTDIDKAEESMNRAKTKNLDLGLVSEKDREPIPAMNRIIHPCLPGKMLPQQLDRLVEKGEEFFGYEASKTSILGPTVANISEHAQRGMHRVYTVKFRYSCI